MIKTVLFDYAGVISPTKNNYTFALKNSKRFGLDPKELMQMSYEGWDEAAIGKLKSNIFWDRIAAKLNIKSDELLTLVIDTFPIDKRMIEIIKKTKENHKTVLFSNQVEDWLEKVIDDNKLRNIFNFFVNSYSVGARKPDEKIFLEALKVTGSKPEETLLVDDSAENVKAARDLNIHAIEFISYEQFIQEFQGYIDLDN